MAEKLRRRFLYTGCEARTESAGETATPDGGESVGPQSEEPAPVILRYIMGQASIRVETAEGKVIYIDPFSGADKDYTPAADPILVTHNRPDHNQAERIENRNRDCRIITQREDSFRAF